MLILLIFTAIISTIYLIKMINDEKKKNDEEEAQYIDNSASKRIKAKYP